jgi:hypothetical protein
MGVVVDALVIALTLCLFAGAFAFVQGCDRW